MLSTRFLRTTSRLRTHSPPIPSIHTNRLTTTPHPGLRQTLPSSPSTLTTTSTSHLAKTFTIGITSGTLGSLCGVGGAVFCTPFLMHYLSLPQRIAAGNSLIAVTSISLTSALSISSTAPINTDLALLLGGAAAVCTPLGVHLSHRIHANSLRKAFGAFMIFLSAGMPLRNWIQNNREKRKENVSVGKWVFGMAGAVVGVAAGALGVSGGSVFTPLIAAMCPEESFRSVIGTSFCAMFIPTVVAAGTYAKMGCVTKKLLPPLVGGAVAGAGLGSLLAKELPEEALRWTFAGLFMALGGRMIRAPAVSKGVVQAFKKKR